MTCFTVVAVAISFALTWLRLVSGSLWPAVFLHSSHNLFMQNVFTPLTSDTGGPIVYIAGDLGVAFLVVALLAEARPGPGHGLSRGFRRVTSTRGLPA